MTKVSQKTATKIKAAVSSPLNEAGKWLKKELKPLLAGVMLHIPHQKLTAEKAVQSWILLDWLEKKISERKAELRIRLLEEAEVNGKETDKRGFRLFVGGNTIMKERRESKTPDEGVLQEIMERNGIPLDAVYDEVKSMQLNPSKLKALIETGALDEEELNASKKISWALKVSSGEELQSVVDEAEQMFCETSKK